jgi:hypothetical protein
VAAALTASSSASSTAAAVRCARHVTNASVPLVPGLAQLTRRGEPLGVEAPGVCLDDQPMQLINT